MGKRPFRMQFIFWLEPDKPDQDALIDHIEHWKGQRLFLPVLRDGLHLMADLMAGRVEVLLKLFPFVEGVILARNGEMERLQNEIDLLKALVAYTQHEVVPSDPGPRPLAVPTVPPPPPDDDDDTLLVVTKAASDSKSAASQNFLDSAFNLLG